MLTNIIIGFVIFVATVTYQYTIGPSIIMAFVGMAAASAAILYSLKYIMDKS